MAFKQCESSRRVPPIRVAQKMFSWHQ